MYTYCEIKDKPLEQMKWILRIIHSCRDTFQINCAATLIDLFHAKFGDETLTTELKVAHRYRYDEIHSILN